MRIHVRFAMVAALLPAVVSAQSTTPQARVVDVDWSSARKAVATGMPTPLQTVGNTYLPVLVPTPFLSDKSLTFVGGRLQYVAAIKDRTASQSITGTRVAFDTPADQSLPNPDGATVTSEVSDKAVLVGTVRYGVAYAIDIECAAANDSRCADDGYARRLLASVTLVGGNRGAPPRAPAAASSSGPAGAGRRPPGFEFEPTGKLVGGSGSGVTLATINAAGIRFPVEASPAYLNSQVWGVGGMKGPAGGQDAKANYSYPWHDNFCETRSYKTPACPAGTGHQGQDIRPASMRGTHWAVAVEDAQVTKIGTYSVTLVGASGNEYRYLHMKMAQLPVRSGQFVRRGQMVGIISNDFGNTKTTVHLHFELRQNAGGRGIRVVSPYTSLVAAYHDL